MMAAGRDVGDEARMVLDSRKWDARYGHDLLAAYGPTYTSYLAITSPSAWAVVEEFFPHPPRQLEFQQGMAEEYVEPLIERLPDADVVLGMITTFDLAKEESAVYDEAQVPSLNNFQSHFRGYRIAQTSPLVIEYYSDQYTLDAELNVANFFPGTPWHTMAVGLLAEAAGDLAFSSDKADANEVEWMSYIAGPSIEILEGHLESGAADGHIPYVSTLGDYISADEADARWANLSAWYEDKGHFWVGNGPFYLEEAFPTEKTVQLLRVESFPDASSKWEGFDTPMIAEVSVDGPARVASGDEATFEVMIDFGGDAYAIDDIDEVKYLVFDALGELALTGAAEAVEDGLWQITLSAEDTAGLESGANKLEVAVAPLRVSIPTFSSLEFVTTN